MDEGDPSDALDIDLDLDLDLDLSLDLFPEDGDDPFPGLEFQSSTLPIRQITRRRQWGTGIEASFTAPYRRYDMSQSPVFRFLRTDVSNLTMTMLSSLIRQIRESLPEHRRPKPPSRTQKRVKAGLIYWLIIHWEIVITYLQTSNLRDHN
jgi:hypothetical protein